MQPIAEQIWDAKYRLKNADGDPIDRTVEDTHRRVASALAAAEAPEKRSHWREQFYHALQDHKFLPAGRIIAGAGTGRNVTLFNCFVMGTVPDSLDGIFEHLREAALTMQQGGGIGYDFSTIRPKGALVKGVDSDASGPLSFMDVWDAMCRTIMSAGARRGAMMGTMRCDHPDIFDFVYAKKEAGRLRNFNMSVLVTDGFMAAVEDDAEWDLCHAVAPVGVEHPRQITSKSTGETIFVHTSVRARDLWDAIMEGTYAQAEPGVIFIDRINETNNLSAIETICATNPCGEQPLPPYGACLLGSINLAALVENAFEKNAGIDERVLRRLVKTAIRMLDNAIDVSNFPLQKQAQEAHDKRRIGLGVTGVADALFMCRVRYGTEEAAQRVEKWLQIIAHAAYAASVSLAEEKGAYPLWDADAVLSGQHFANGLPESVKKHIRQKGMRNSHLLSIAPTGTISLYAGNLSSGIEPIFASSYTRKVLQRDGSRTEERVVDYAVAKWESLQVEPHGYPADRTLPDYYVDATSLSPAEHVRMQAAAQLYVDTSISKTVNLPESISFEDFKEVYWDAFRQGCKGCTTYRPNEITGSILSVDEKPEPAPEEKQVWHLDESDDFVCPICDGGPGNNGACTCPKEWKADDPSLEDMIEAARGYRMTEEEEAAQIESFAKGNLAIDKPEPLAARMDPLPGATYKLKFGANPHATYVTINNSGGRPFEVFVNSKNVEHFAWAAALTRMISAVFRRGGDVRFVAEELKEVFDPKGGAWMDGKYVPSLPAAIGGVIERHMDALDLPEEPRTDAQDVVEAADRVSEEGLAGIPDACPACGDYAMVPGAGCATCASCGYSKCG